MKVNRVALDQYNGILYAAYLTDGGCTDKDQLIVKKYNGTSWIPVGTNPISINLQRGVDFYKTGLIVSQGTPYIAFREGINYEPKVLKYDNSWNELGDLSQQKTNAIVLDLFVEDNIAYIAFQDDVHNASLTVMKYDTNDDLTTWEYVGQPGFSPEIASDYSLFVDEETPYISFYDPDCNGKISVMKYSGDYWDYVGEQGFSDDTVGTTSLIVYNGTPYVAFDDGKARVMKYNGSKWVNVGNKHFSQNYTRIYLLT